MGNCYVRKCVCVAGQLNTIMSYFLVVVEESSREGLWGITQFHLFPSDSFLSCGVMEVNNRNSPPPPFPLLPAPPFHLFIFCFSLSICSPPPSLSLCVSVCLSICLSVYLSVCPSACLSVCLSVCLSLSE